MTIVLNEDVFIEPCLNGIYDFADEIILVEGCVPYTRWLGQATAEGGSIDNTSSIIKNYMNSVDSKLNKIQYVPPHIYSSKIEMRNEALKRCSGEWVMLVDADEFYTEEDLLKIRHRAAELNKNHPKAAGITYPFKQFWSMSLYAEGVIMERVFRKTSTAMYDGIPKDGQNIYIDGQKLWGSGRTIHHDDIFCYHYSPLLINNYMFNRFKIKSKYYGARQLNIQTESEFIDKQGMVERAAEKEQIRLMKLVLDTKECSKTEHPVAFKKSKLYRDFYELVY